MISSVSQAGQTGIQRGMAGLSANAAEIASIRQQGSSTRDISQPLVEQTQNLRQVEASAKVLQASDESIGRLLDVMA